MTSPHQAGQVGELDWLLTSFVQKIPDVAHALTVSVDGLALAVSAGLPSDRADQLAAITSGLASLTTGAAKVLTAGRVRQSVVDMDEGVLLLMSVGDRAQVAVLAQAGCDLGLVGYETALLVKRVAAALEPAARRNSQHRLSRPRFGRFTIEGPSRDHAAA